MESCVFECDVKAKLNRSRSCWYGNNIIASVQLFAHRSTLFQDPPRRRSRDSSRFPAEINERVRLCRLLCGGFHARHGSDRQGEVATLSWVGQEAERVLLGVGYSDK
jgi:hypothetical protein